MLFRSVFKALTGRRSSEDVSYNDVLRDLLGLGSQKKPIVSGNSVHKSGYWMAKGVRFPVGTSFRATYKGQQYFGVVKAEGLVVQDKCFSSPSAAAIEITGKSANGWTFFECRLPDTNTWQMIKSLRQQKRDF